MWWPRPYLLRKDIPHMVQPPQGMQFMMRQNPQPVPMPMIPMPQLNPQMPTVTKLIVAKHNNVEKEALAQLFADKKISLSDYLSLTANFTDNTKPVNIQNKIRVISRCQDAIRELNGEVKITGTFTVTKTQKTSERPPDVKNMSPFKKIPVVRFQFTTPAKPNEDKPNLTNALNRLLVKIGCEPIFNCSPKPSPVLQDTGKDPVEVEVIPSETTRSCIKQLNKFTQTQAFKCSDCETRNLLQYENVCTQTSDCLTFDIACQVSPEDFQKSLRGILKNQSLASLTPAQLLAQRDPEEIRSLDMFFGKRKSPAPSGSPDPKKISISREFERFVNRGTDDERSYTNRFRTQPNPNEFDIGTRQRPESISSNRAVSSEVRNPFTGSPFGQNKTLPFSNISSKLNFEPPAPFNSRNPKPFFEPPPSTSQQSQPFNFPRGRRY